MAQRSLPHAADASGTLLCGLLPSGRIDVHPGSPDDGLDVSPPVQRRICEAFAAGRGHGVLHLGARELNTDLHSPRHGPPAQRRDDDRPNSAAPRAWSRRPAGEHAAGSAQLPQCRRHRQCRVFNQPDRLPCLSRRVPHLSRRSAPTPFTVVVRTMLQQHAATACFSCSVSWRSSVTSVDGLLPSCPQPILTSPPRHTPCSSGHLHWN